MSQSDYERIARIGYYHNIQRLPINLEYAERLGRVASTAAGKRILSVARNHQAYIVADALYPDSAQFHGSLGGAKENSANDSETPETAQSGENVLFLRLPLPREKDIAASAADIAARQQMPHQ